MDSLELASRLQQDLDDLAEAEGGVVRRLLDLDCRGVRSNACLCPVAVYLNRRAVEYGHHRVFITVGTATAHISQPSIAIVTGDFGIPLTLPKRVQQFVIGFDRGLYTSLVAS